MTSGKIYSGQIKKVSAYLNIVVVATIEMILEETKVPPHAIRRMLNDKILTSSLNFDHGWYILTKDLKQRKDHWGFFHYRIKKWSREIIIFHDKRTAKATLSYLASRLPWGISESEAKEMLGRDCNRVLRELKRNNNIHVRLYNGDKVYVSRFNKKAQLQMNHRRTNPRFGKEEDEEESEIEVITFEELCRTFSKVVTESKLKPSISVDRLCAILLMTATSRSFRTNELWIAHNKRIMDATGMLWPVDHTTLWRAFDNIGEKSLKELFHQLVIRLHDKKVITGKFLIVDATHIFAYCNIRKDTNNNPVEGAEWGDHHGSFYGYKVHLLIDAESEMPVSMILSPGNDHDSIHFIPLIEEFEKKYDFEDSIAVLADGAYDVEEFKKIVYDKTGGVFLPACNPRNSKILATMKNTVKKLFKEHGHKIHSVKDAFRYLGQKFLTDFSIDIGTSNETKFVELISERLHRPLRAGVERVFSNLKSMASFERPKTREPDSVKRTIWWCLIAYLTQALAAHEKGSPESMRKRTLLV